MEINLEEYLEPGVRVLSGSTHGYMFRQRLQLDRIDRTPGMVVIIRIPETIYSITDSFVMGLFERSIEYLGGERFRRKYMFEGRDDVVRRLEASVDLAVRHTENALQQRNQRRMMIRGR